MALELTFGFNAHVYKLLYDWVLPFRGLRVPARAYVLVLLGVAVIAGVGFSRLIASLRRVTRAPRVWGAAIPAIVLAMVVAEYFTMPRLRVVDRDVPIWYSWLEQQDDAVIFEWPVTVPWRLYEMVDLSYMARSTIHWRPMLNGYSGFYPESYLRLLVEMRSFPDTKSLKVLRDRGATILVLHEYPETRVRYLRAIERLMRDPLVEPIAQDRDGRGRVAFFRLLPKPKPASSETAQQQDRR